MRMVVDLPAPFAPRKPKISPCCTSSVMPSTATKSPKRLVRPSSSTAAAMASAARGAQRGRRRPGAAPPGPTSGRARRAAGPPRRRAARTTGSRLRDSGRPRRLRFSRADSSERSESAHARAGGAPLEAALRDLQADAALQVRELLPGRVRARLRAGDVGAAPAAVEQVPGEAHAHVPRVVPVGGGRQDPAVRVRVVEAGRRRTPGAGACCARRARVPPRRRRAPRGRRAPGAPRARLPPVPGGRPARVPRSPAAPPARCACPAAGPSSRVQVGLRDGDVAPRLQQCQLRSIALDLHRQHLVAGGDTRPTRGCARPPGARRTRPATRRGPPPCAVPSPAPSSRPPSRRRGPAGRPLRPGRSPRARARALSMARSTRPPVKRGIDAPSRVRKLSGRLGKRVAAIHGTTARARPTGACSPPRARPAAGVPSGPRARPPPPARSPARRRPR